MDSTCAPQPGRGGCAPSSTRSLDTLADIVQHYVENVRGRACAGLAYYASQLSLDHVLEVVASWRNEEDLCESHQCRVTREAKQAAAERIRQLDVKSATTFEEVFRRVQDAIGDIRGIGDLAVYDVSLRIGALLGLAPERVYLQGGARHGARALGIQSRERALPVNAFPPEFRRLHAWEIENLLCIYKRKLGQARRAA